MNFIERLFFGPTRDLYEKVLAFLPNLLMAFVVFIVGIAFAILSKNIFQWLLRAASLDRLFERTGTAELLRRGGLREPVSLMLAMVLEWIILAAFGIIAVRVLQIPALERVLETFLLYLPNAFVAVVILLIGYMLGNFFGRAALIASVNAGIAHSGIIARLVKLSVFLLSLTMSMEQLGIGKETVIIAFAILFGGAVLALSLAFGLGGRDVAKDFIENRFNRKKNENDGLRHL